MYYSTYGPADSDLDTGAFLDIATSNSGVIEFDFAETLNFDLANSPIDICDRWESWGEPIGLSDDFIDELYGFQVVNGIGINEMYTDPNALVFDAGYDVDADAFLFARVDFTAVGSGTVDLLTSSGDGLIVHDGEIVPATFGGATITVGVPEPASFIALAAIGLVISTRRKR